MRRNPPEEGRRWLEQAEEDLRWAEDLAQRGGYHIACFLAQQIGEKALEAFLYAQGEEVVLGHSVERLCDEAAAREPRFEEKRSRWAILDGYYIPTRYPHEYRTWLGDGHTVRSRNPPEPYAPGIRQCGAAIVSPWTSEREFGELNGFR